MTSKVTCYVLAALLNGRLHGYGVIRQVEFVSGGARAQGLVEPDGEEQVDSRPPRYCRITDDRAEAVRAEAERMRRAARAVTRPATAGAAG